MSLAGWKHSLCRAVENVFTSQPAFNEAKKKSEAYPRIAKRSVERVELITEAATIDVESMQITHPDTERLGITLTQLCYERGFPSTAHHLRLLDYVGGHARCSSRRHHLHLRRANMPRPRMKLFFAN